MIAEIDIPFGGRTVLQNIATGRSPWHGWDAGHPARSGEGRDAYAARAEAIRLCRQAGLVTPENLLTARGREAVRLLEAAYA